MHTEGSSTRQFGSSFVPIGIVSPHDGIGWSVLLGVLRRELGRDLGEEPCSAWVADLTTDRGRAAALAALEAARTDPLAGDCVASLERALAASPSR